MTVRELIDCLEGYPEHLPIRIVFMNATLEAEEIDASNIYSHSSWDHVEIQLHGEIDVHWSDRQ